MKTRLAIGAGLLLCLGCGQAFSVEPVSLRSRSGQFFVRGLPLSAPPLSPATNAEVTYVRLDPTLLAVSCERIKEAVLAELVMKDLWRGKICISLHPVRADHEPIEITSVHYSDGWSYRMEIPEQVDAARLVRSVVEVVLQELANRNAKSLAAELPLWLKEGMAAHLQDTTLANFTLEPETRIVRRQRGQDPLRHTRERLSAHPPLTLNELNWPSEEQISDENVETYQCCAQLFVYELLRLRDGRACLREMLACLPENLNWQTAFLRAFSPYFQRLLDVDKWWSLSVAHVTGQGFASAWAREEIDRQLDDILTTPVQVRLSPQELPLNTLAKLQSILAEWDFPRQQPVLRQKLNLLAALRLRTSQDSAGLVEEYRQTIESYLQHRSRLGGSNRKGEPLPNAKLIISETNKRLDDLDARRQAPRKPASSPPQISLSQ